MVNLSLNQTEINALLALLDMAVKSGGIQVAENAVFFVKKIQEAASSNQTKVEASPSPE